MAKGAKRNGLGPEDQHLALMAKASHSLFWNSTIFSDVYLQNDVPIIYDSLWNREDGEFQTFLDQFRNFCETFKGENPTTWSERTTIDRAVKPVLRMLGWVSSDKSAIDPWLEDESFSYQEADGAKTYKPDLILVDQYKELKHIQSKKGQEKIDKARRHPNTPGGVIFTVEAKYWDRIEEYRQNKREDNIRADKKQLSDSSKGLDFDDQCLKYMEMLNNGWGVLTDGKTWRLYNLSSANSGHKQYFQFNLGYLLSQVFNIDIFI